jgi:hypothetical protein
MPHQQFGSHAWFFIQIAAGSFSRPSCDVADELSDYPQGALTMSKNALRLTRSGFIAFVLFACAVATTSVSAQIPQAQAIPSASADDTARFFAGMPLPADSPLAQLAQDPTARQHAANLDRAFGIFEKLHLSKVRAWANANLTAPKPVMFYMFGGPDFLYADAFFPNATTYVLQGLEPVGAIPDLAKMPRWATIQSLWNIHNSLRSILSVTYFITVQMRSDLSASGTLPMLYVFLARTGKTIHEVSLVHLDEQGVLHQGDQARPPSPARGVKIVFSEKDGPHKTLYYFSANLADQRSRNIALLQFCKSLGPADSFTKSASYLLHGANFSQVRNFLLENANTILQDATGIPLSYFDRTKWKLRGYGQLVIPNPPTRPTPIDFGIGYQFRPNQTSLLLATRSLAAARMTNLVPEAVPIQPEIEARVAVR